jgi:molecular chaperone GrpE
MTDPRARSASGTSAADESSTNPASDLEAELAEVTREPTPSTALERDLADTKDRLLRALAEMDNMRKRTEREIADSRAYGITVFARDVLNVADSMHRALDGLGVELRERSDANVKALLEGVELTERELLKVLEKHGVKKLEPLGQKFDPNRHQAMYEVPDPSAPPGTVVQVVQAGFTIGERVLRPALVAIAKAVAKPEAESPSANDNSGEAA